MSRDVQLGFMKGFIRMLTMFSIGKSDDIVFVVEINLKG